MIESQKDLLPNPYIYAEAISLPEHIKTSIESIDKSKLGEDSKEQEAAKKMLENWASTLWKATVYIANTPKITSDSDYPSDLIEKFKERFARKLSEFIVHKDHGMIHSFYVYKGMVHLVDLDKEQGIHEEYDDRLAQLLALTHDLMQTLPFDILEKPGINQRNKHAVLIALIVRKFAEDFGFNKEEAKKLAFGLRKHDSTYNGIFYPNGEFEYLAKLLHDADKLYGTSTNKDPSALASGMLERNFIANEIGSFLIVTELDIDHRRKFKYGDRCVNDAIAVVLRELSLPMYTESGEGVAKERIAHVLEKIDTVYGGLFDETKKVIEDVIEPSFHDGKNSVTFSVGGLGNEIKPIDKAGTPFKKPSNETELEELLSKLYSTPLPLPEKYQRKGYDNLNAKGWKLFVKKGDEEEYPLDPSIARFCFSKDGKETFINHIKEAFIDQLNLDIESV